MDIEVGRLIVIKRKGGDGNSVPIYPDCELIIGRNLKCDIVVKLDYVSRRHASLKFVSEKGDSVNLDHSPSVSRFTIHDDDKEAVNMESHQLNIGRMYITNHSKINPTKVNGKPIHGEKEVELQHQDVFTIGDRSFRFEFDEKVLQKCGIDDDETVYMEKDEDTDDDGFEDSERPATKKAKKEIIEPLVRVENKENLNTINIAKTNDGSSKENQSFNIPSKITTNFQASLKEKKRSSLLNDTSNKIFGYNDTYFGSKNEAIASLRHRRMSAPLMKSNMNISEKKNLEGIMENINHPKLTFATNEQNQKEEEEGNLNSQEEKESSDFDPLESKPDNLEEEKESDLPKVVNDDNLEPLESRPDNLEQEKESGSFIANDNKNISPQANSDESVPGTHQIAPPNLVPPPVIVAPRSLPTPLKRGIEAFNSQKSIKDLSPIQSVVTPKASSTSRTLTEASIGRTPFCSPNGVIFDSCTKNTSLRAASTTKKQGLSGTPMNFSKSALEVAANLRAVDALLEERPYLSPSLLKQIESKRKSLSMSLEHERKRLTLHNRCLLTKESPFLVKKEPKLDLETKKHAKRLSFSKTPSKNENNPKLLQEMRPDLDVSCTEGPSLLKTPAKNSNTHFPSKLPSNLLNDLRIFDQNKLKRNKPLDGRPMSLNQLIKEAIEARRKSYSTFSNSSALSSEPIKEGNDSPIQREGPSRKVNEINFPADLPDVTTTSLPRKSFQDSDLEKMIRSPECLQKHLRLELLRQIEAKRNSPEAKFTLPANILQDIKHYRKSSLNKVIFSAKEGKDLETSPVYNCTETFKRQSPIKLTKAISSHTFPLRNSNFSRLEIVDQLLNDIIITALSGNEQKLNAFSIVSNPFEDVVNVRSSSNFSPVGQSTGSLSFPQELKKAIEERRNSFKPKSSLTQNILNELSKKIDHKGGSDPDYFPEQIIEEKNRVGSTMSEARPSFAQELKDAIENRKKRAECVNRKHLMESIEARRLSFEDCSITKMDVAEMPSPMKPFEIIRELDELLVIEDDCTKISGAELLDSLLEGVIHKFYPRSNNKTPTNVRSLQKNIMKGKYRDTSSPINVTPKNCSSILNTPGPYQDSPLSLEEEESLVKSMTGLSLRTIKRKSHQGSSIIKYTGGLPSLTPCRVNKPVIASAEESVSPLTLEPGNTYTPRKSLTFDSFEIKHSNDPNSLPECTRKSTPRPPIGSGLISPGSSKKLQNTRRLRFSRSPIVLNQENMDENLIELSTRLSDSLEANFNCSNYRQSICSKNSITTPIKEAQEEDEEYDNEDAIEENPSNEIEKERTEKEDLLIHDMKLIDLCATKILGHIETTETTKAVEASDTDKSFAYGFSLDKYLENPAGFRNSFGTCDPKEHETNIGNDMDYMNQMFADLKFTKQKYSNDTSGKEDRVCNDNHSMVLGGRVKRKDSILIENYAKELQNEGEIKEHKAYGVALDVFLSDTQAFRRLMERKEEFVEKDGMGPHEKHYLAGDSPSGVREKDSTARLYRPGPIPLISTPISLSTGTSSSKPNMPEKSKNQYDGLSQEQVDSSKEKEGIKIENVIVVDDSMNPKDEIIVKEEITLDEKENLKNSTLSGQEGQVHYGDRLFSRQEMDNNDKSEEEEDTFICCEGCETWFRLDSLSIDEIPEGDWFCAPCIPKTQSKNTRPKRNSSKKNKSQMEQTEKKTRQNKGRNSEEKGPNSAMGSSSQSGSRRSTRRSKSESSKSSTSSTAVRRSTRSSSTRSTRSSK